MLYFEKKTNTKKKKKAKCMLCVTLIGIGGQNPTAVPCGQWSAWGASSIRGQHQSEDMTLCFQTRLYADRPKAKCKTGHDLGGHVGSSDFGLEEGCGKEITGEMLNSPILIHFS